MFYCLNGNHDIHLTGDVNNNVCSGAGDDAVVAGNGNDLLGGDTGSDFLMGGAGLDTRDGGVDDDDMRGGEGDDELHGELGSDIPHGGRGADLFYYVSLAESGRVSAGVVFQDRIRDFEAGGDTFDVCDVNDKGGTPQNDAQIFMGTGAFTAAGQLRVRQDGLDTILEINTSSSFGTAAMSVRPEGVVAASPVADHFVL
jgi:hypothetical protein